MILVLTDGADHTAEAFADAAIVAGHRVVLADLRVDRFSLRIGASEPLRMNGTVIEPSVVLNRTGVNGLGLAPPSALLRAPFETWYGRHVVAREEQGLLLALFDRLALDGVRILNPPRATELALMRNLVVERLASRRVVFAAPTGGRVERLLVLDGRIFLRPGQSQPPRGVQIAAKAIAEVAEFQLGEIVAETTEAGWLLQDWTPQADLSDVAGPALRAMADAIVREILDPVADGGGSTSLPSELFIPDLVENVRNPPVTR